jgi:two-component system chemotaxis response regulator CheB
VIGCSTGGPAAATQVLNALPTGLGLAVLIVQHMPAGFTASFADRLNRLTQYDVSEAAHGAALQADTMYVAPGGMATLVRPNGSLQIAPHNAGDVYVPNINRTFRSIATAGLAGKTIAIVMTGMGDDGADGLVALEAAGADTIVQNPDEAVVAGMVMAALARGAGKRVLLLDEMPRTVIQVAQAHTGSRSGAEVRAALVVENRSR